MIYLLRQGLRTPYIRRLLPHHERRQERSHNTTPRTVREFDRELRAQSYLDLYKDILTKRTQCAPQR